MPYLQLGSGRCFASPSGGNLVTNPTPQRLFTIGDLSLDISADVVELYGENQFPDDVGVTKKKVTGKLTLGTVDPMMLNQIFFAETVTTGTDMANVDEAGVVPGVSTYTVTVTNSANFTQDLGVLHAANTKQRFTRVASGPTAGQYSVSAGVYTFAAADANANVLISYISTAASQGNSFIAQNHAIGYGPTFELVFVQAYQATAGVANGIHLYAARATKLSQGMKQADYTKPEIDFSCFTNSAGQLFKWINASGF